MSAESYLASLPEVETYRLPQGTLFVAKGGSIYQVTETGQGGYSKARQWRQSEKTEVALIPGSPPARYLPLVPRGRLLPVYRSRNDLLFNGQPRWFVFPTETFALDAISLDVALIVTPGAYIRRSNHEPSFAITDGVRIFRLGYYQQTTNGHLTHINPSPYYELQSYKEGSLYWQILSSWPMLDHMLVTV